MTIFMIFACVVSILMTGAAILMAGLFCIGMPKMTDEVRVQDVQ